MGNGSEHNDRISCSWCWRNQYQSQWLHSTLSELDKSTNQMLALMKQEDDDTFAQRAEMYYQKRPELVKMVEEFRRTYHSLAEFCGHMSIRSSLRSRSSITQFESCYNSFKDANGGGVGSSDSNAGSFTELDDDIHGARAPRNLEPPHKESVDDISLVDDESTVTAETEKVHRVKNSRTYIVCDGIEGCEKADTIEKRMSCSEKMSRIMDDTVSELARRNEEKREANKELERQVRKLVEENQILHDRLSKLIYENAAFRLKLGCRRDRLRDERRGVVLHHSNAAAAAAAKPKRSQLSRLKTVIFSTCVAND